MEMGLLDHFIERVVEKNSVSSRDYRDRAVR